MQMSWPAETDAETLGAIGEILADLLGVGRVAPDQGFRQLGGDSLRAVKAVGMIAAEFGTPDATNELLLEALLDGADASTLARLVDDPGAAAGQPPAGAGGHSAARALSYGEERLWLAQRYHPDSAAYHVVNAFLVSGDLDLAALDHAVQALVGRHPALRTRYDRQQPRVIGDEHVPGGRDGSADIEHRDVVLPWPQALALAEAEAIAPFDLAAGRLLRIRSYPVEGGTRLLVVAVHHIATDGWSMELIYAELGELYAGHALGPVPSAYAEFARWQRAASGPLADAEAFAARLRPLPDRLDLGHRQRPPARSMSGAVLRARLPAATTSRLRSLARGSGSSLYEVLLTAFYLCLARRSRQWDLLVGTVASARTQPRFHGTAGFFAATLPVRVTAGLDTPVDDLLRRVRAEVRWVLTHQEVPLEELAVRARSAADRARAPLVDAVLVLQSGDGLAPRLAGCSLARVPLHAGGGKFDLMLEAIPADGGELELSWEYASDVLDGEDVADLAASFAEIAAALDGPGATVRSATGLSTAERERLASLAGPAREWPAQGASELFEHLAAVGPAHPAVLDQDATVDRARLRELREAVAGCLIAHGVRPGDVVAVHLPRSARSVAALLATWWIGAVPVFIDVHHPDGHRDALVRACRPAAVLTADSAGWPQGMSVMCWSEAECCQESPGPPACRAPGDPAWLVATSGSTGAPKITVGTHRGLLNRCAWAWETFPYAGREVAALRTPLGFVDAIAEAAVPLLAGVPLAVVPDRAAWDARELAAVLGRHQVTRLLGTPSLLRHLLEAVPDLAAAAAALRWCACSGEPLGGDLLIRLQTALPACRLINLYGSSEVAGDATYADVTDLPAGRPAPIGRPVANTRVLVADGAGELVAPGVTGELVVTGAPVGRGYLVNGDLAPAGGFRPAPGGEPGYWTGDMGWLDADGQLQYAGRRDRQVKVRGCRVELDQVEAVLLAQAGVGQAVAWAGSAADGSSRIEAAVAPDPGAAPSGNWLREQVRDRLPSYMVPARIAIVAALPVSANGKLDRAGAARLADGQHPRKTAAPPVSPAQHRLQLLWSSVLGGELAGPDEDFFALGGDSLAANSMLAAVMRETGVELGVGDFLAEPTIRALAARLPDTRACSRGAGERAG